VKAVVLVGGFGTRLRPLTLHTPKQMLPMVGVPMIERVVTSLAACGVTDAILSLGYRPDAFLEAYPDDQCAGVHLHYAVEPEPLDTAGAVRFAALDAGLDSRFLVVNGDVLTDLDVRALWDFHTSSGAEGTIALTRVDDPSRYGVVPIDEAGRVEAFVEKPEPGTAPSHWINAGTYVLEPSVLDRIPDGRKVSIERSTFPAMVEDGTLFAQHSDAYWVDAGTPATYLESQLDLVDGTRSDEVAVAPGADIDPAAKVDHAVVYAGARVLAGAVVENAAVLAGAVVGANAVVRDSIVGPGAQIGDGAELRDLTVIGADEQVAPGTVLAGARVPDPDDA